MTMANERTALTLDQPPEPEDDPLLHGYITENHLPSVETFGAVISEHAYRALLAFAQERMPAVIHKQIERTFVVRAPEQEHEKLFKDLGRQFSDRLLRAEWGVRQYFSGLRSTSSLSNGAEVPMFDDIRDASFIHPSECMWSG